jgi:nitroreductase
MDVLSAIKTRRSIGKVKQDPVPKGMIETILEAGTWAPNHYRTEPWKFFVMTGDGRNNLGEVLGEIAIEGMESSIEREDKRKRAEAKPLRAPVVIAVAVSPSDNPKVILKEEYAAASAAVQNMLLTAHSLGLGAIWRTGKPTYHPKVQQLFSLQGSEEVVGFIYIGYPDLQAPIAKRIPFQQKTVWIEE